MKRRRVQVYAPSAILDPAAKVARDRALHDALDIIEADTETDGRGELCWLCLGRGPYCNCPDDVR